MEYLELPINEVELDLDNPRIKHYIEIYGDNITSEGLSLALSASGGNSNSSTFEALKNSIKVNRGIINPIIVNRDGKGKLFVVEGNTRLQIYREFAIEEPNGPWNKIIAIVYDDLPTDEIHAIRLQTHLVGPRDWDPFSKAKYLYELSNIYHMPMSMIISFCGGKSSEIAKYIQAYSDMMKYYWNQMLDNEEDPEPKEFSKFVELQNRSIKDSLIAHNYTEKDFAKWVVNRNIDTAQNVRKLPGILGLKKAKDIFMSSNITEAYKYINVNDKKNAELDNASIDELVLILVERIRNIPNAEVKNLRWSSDFSQKKSNIKALIDELANLWVDIKEG